MACFYWRVFLSQNRCPLLRNTFASLFYFFPQHFQLQPSVFGCSQFLLRCGHGGGSLVEFLAIFPVEIGIVKPSLLFCDLGLQLFDRFGQCFQRVLLVEAQPAL